MPGAKLGRSQMARRAAQEMRPGEAVALGPGLPGLIGQESLASSGVWLISDSGAVGYRLGDSESGRANENDTYAVDSSAQAVILMPGGAVVGVADLAGMLRGGHVGLAVVEAGQVSAGGDFCHWSTTETAGLAAPGTAVDLAFGAGRVVALLPHTAPDGSPNIVERCGYPVDGLGCVGLIVTDVAVMAVGRGGLELVETAPGWSAEEIAAMTGAPFSVSHHLRDMSFDVPRLALPNKVYATAVEAVSDVPEGAMVNIDGFAGPGGMPHYLMTGLRDQGAKGLTIISNTAGIARVHNFGTPEGVTPIDHTILVENGQVSKAIASYPVSPSASRPSAFEEAYNRGEATLEVSPQGTLAERLRCGGAGVAAFYTPTAAGTLLGEGKETRTINGKEHVLEDAIFADFCIIRGYKADTLGNVVYKGTSRNFNPVMATAARVTVVEVDEIVEPGELDPEEIVSPGIFIDRIVKRPADFSPYL